LPEASLLSVTTAGNNAAILPTFREAREGDCALSFSIAQG
jgi:hypothetical protein